MKFVNQIALGIAFMLLISCQENDTIIDSKCLLERIVYNESTALKFKTISQGRVYQIQEQNFSSKLENSIVGTISFSYNNNKVIIDDLSDSYIDPILVAEYEAGKLIRVTKTILTSGVNLVHDLKYSNEVLHIDITWRNKIGDSLKFGYADYSMNERGNVKRITSYRYTQEEQEVATLTDDRIFTYDENKSPWQGLLYPFFEINGFVDIKFFSNNNITNVSDQFIDQDYSYQYNEQGYPTELYLEDTNDLVRFEYLNCGDNF